MGTWIAPIPLLLEKLEIYVQIPTHICRWQERETAHPPLIKWTEHIRATCFQHHVPVQSPARWHHVGPFQCATYTAFLLLFWLPAWASQPHFPPCPWLGITHRCIHFIVFNTQWLDPHDAPGTLLTGQSCLSCLRGPSIWASLTQTPC